MAQATASDNASRAIRSDRRRFDDDRSRPPPLDRVASSPPNGRDRGRERERDRVHVPRLDSPRKHANFDDISRDYGHARERDLAHHSDGRSAERERYARDREYDTRSLQRRRAPNRENFERESMRQIAPRDTSPYGDSKRDANGGRHGQLSRSRTAHVLLSEREKDSKFSETPFDRDRSPDPSPERDRGRTHAVGDKASSPSLRKRLMMAANGRNGGAGGYQEVGSDTRSGMKNVYFSLS